MDITINLVLLLLIILTIMMIASNEEKIDISYSFANYFNNIHRLLEYVFNNNIKAMTQNTIEHINMNNMIDNISESILLISNIFTENYGLALGTIMMEELTIYTKLLLDIVMNIDNNSNSLYNSSNTIGTYLDVTFKNGIYKRSIQEYTNILLRSIQNKTISNELIDKGNQIVKEIKIDTGNTYLF